MAKLFHDLPAGHRQHQRDRGQDRAPETEAGHPAAQLRRFPTDLPDPGRIPAPPDLRRRQRTLQGDHAGDRGAAQL